MPDFSQFQHVSAAPTNPQPAAGPKAFDVADLYSAGPVRDVAVAADGAVPLDEKLRQAYFWIVNHAIISPHFDLEYFAGPHQTYTFGDSQTRVNLPSGQSYSSFVLLPLLNFAVRRLEFFASQFEFLESAAEQLEYKTKDTAKLASADRHLLSAQETGKDRVKDLGAQTKNGLSVRALMTVLVFAKALTYFRGQRVVELDDLRQILPFVLHDKLQPDPDAPFFEAPGNAVLRVDRISWIRRLFDLACAEYDRLNLDHDDPVAEMDAQFSLGLEGLDEASLRARLVKIELSLDLVGREFLGPNSRYPALAEGWSWLFSRLPDRLVEAPRLFPGAVTNALYNLSTTPGARPRDWMQAVVALSAVCRDVHELLSAAQVAAWRAGLAHFRLSALERCRALDPRTGVVALGLPAGDGQPPIPPKALDALIDALLADPWLDPAAVELGAKAAGPARLELVRRVGAFRGFGGLFMAPPTVSCPGGQFVVTDHQDHWLLFADRFGASFHRIESLPDEKPQMSIPLYQVSLAGTVSKGLYSAHFPELERSQSSAANRTTLAVTTPLSHAVYLIAPVRA